MAQVMISGLRKSSGKTTVSLGLCAALSRRGHVVQPFKKGPDYIDPMWLAEAAGRPCYNLDFHTMTRRELTASFARHSRGSDIAVIEGNKGLHDGLALQGEDSNAALAGILGAPVVLVVDAEGTTRGIAPLILGCQAFAPDVPIAGVILNNVGGSRHEAKLRAAIGYYTPVPVIGAIPRDPALAITERHLGLIPTREDGKAKNTIERIADVVSRTVDLDRLMAIAESAPSPSAWALDADSAARRSDVRIAIARDAAFGFYYAPDIEGLAAAGAELIEFDTLTDPHLPAVDGVLIGGGFPETHLEALAANNSLRSELRAAIEQGLPVYAECGGLMYLSRSLSWNGRHAEMVGAIPADTIMYQRPVGHGYVRLRETGASPWPGPRAANLVAHEFHYSALTGIDHGVDYAYEVLRGTGIDGCHDGLVYRNVLASYSHLRDSETNRWTERFVAFVRKHKSSQGAPLRLAAGA